MQRIYTYILYFGSYRNLTLILVKRVSVGNFLSGCPDAALTSVRRGTCRNVVPTALSILAFHTTSVFYVVIYTVQKFTIT